MPIHPLEQHEGKECSQFIDWVLILTSGNLMGARKEEVYLLVLTFSPLRPQSFSFSPFRGREAQREVIWVTGKSCKRSEGGIKISPPPPPPAQSRKI